jgi:MoaA/NifB/PqqE/SkfB family radical SAM enzyme
MNEELKLCIQEIFERRTSDGAVIDITKLVLLWDSLETSEGFFEVQQGPYPAGHGKKHIEQVLKNLTVLLKGFELPQFNKNQLSELFAATMIHDIGMIKTLQKGAYAIKARESHAEYRVIYNLSYNSLRRVGFDDNEINRIVTIASAHAGDNKESSEEKIENVKRIMIIPGKSHLFKSVALLRLSDYCDIGRERLIKPVDKIKWNKVQIEHLKKHLLISKTMDHNRITFETPPIALQVDIPLLEQFSILRTVHEEAKDHIGLLKESQPDQALWEVTPLDEEMFGQIYPRSKGLFTEQLKRAMKDWKKNGNGAAMPVHITGHSLYARFVADAEGLNRYFLDGLSSPEKNSINMKCLLIDPSVENQQVCEVYDAQRGSQDPKEKERSILPSYNEDWVINTSANADNKENDNSLGDINRSLKTLSVWKNKVRGGSSLEVRLTTRLMYSSVMRLGNRIIVTPYRKGGLFGASLALVLTKRSPLFESYLKEFEGSWESAMETRLAVHKYGDPLSAGNPLIRRLHNVNQATKIPPLDYERFLLTGHADRIQKIIDGGIPIPPLEVEIQPSEECDFKCVHCIGRHLSPKHEEASILRDYDLQSLLEYNVDGFIIERFRISGLFGDPLSKSARETTLNFIKSVKECNIKSEEENRDAEKRKVILLTNGLALGEENVQAAMNDVACLHVSLDAGTKDTFAILKRYDARFYDNILNNVRNLCDKKRNNELTAQIGLGFVITQQNAHEVRKMIKVGERLAVDFVRFKADLRGPNSISWRTWREAEKMIQKEIAEERDMDIILTNVASYHYRAPVTDQCWVQRLTCTVGPDGCVYPCDHLTACDKSVSLGNLREKTFKEIWEKSVWPNGKRLKECSVCPPFNWRTNRLLDEINVLSTCYTSDTVKARFLDNLQG